MLAEDEDGSKGEAPHGMSQAAVARRKQGIEASQTARATARLYG